MNSRTGTAAVISGSCGTPRGPLFRAVREAALHGTTRHAFASRAGLTGAEVLMLERANGVSLRD